MKKIHTTNNSGNFYYESNRNIPKKTQEITKKSIFKSTDTKIKNE